MFDMGMKASQHAAQLKQVSIYLVLGAVFLYILNIVVYTYSKKVIARGATLNLGLFTGFTFAACYYAHRNMVADHRKKTSLTVREGRLCTGQAFGSCGCPGIGL